MLGRITRVVPWVAAVVALGAPFAGAQVQRTVVARSGQLTSSGDLVGRIDAAFTAISPTGRVAFMSSGPFDPEDVRTYITGNGRVDVLTRGTEPAVPGDPTRPLSASVFRFDAAGNLFVHGVLPLTQLPPAGVGDSGDNAVLIAALGGRTVLAREGDRAPGTPAGVVYTGRRVTEDGRTELEGGFGLRAVAGDRRFAFTATLGGPGVPVNQQAVFAGTPGNVALVARAGDPAPGGGTFDAVFGIPFHAVNAAGEVAFIDGKFNVGSTSLYAGAPGALRRIARRSDPVPGRADGATYAEIRGASLNAGGDVAFNAEFDLGAQPREVVNNAIFLATGGGPARLISAGHDPAPGVPGATFFSFGTPTITDAGRMIVLASVDAGVAYRQGIWAGAPDDLRSVVVERGPVPGMPGRVFDDGFYYYANQVGQLAFFGSIRTDDPTEAGRNTASIWLTDAAGIPYLVARSGDMVDPGDGTPRLVTDVGVYGLNDAGQMVYRLDFGVEAQALLIATVPEPSVLAPLSAVVAIARRGRRTRA